MLFQRCGRCRRIRLCDVRPGMTNVVCELCVKAQARAAESANQ
jgi:hypothetical protein